MANSSRPPFTAHGCHRLQWLLHCLQIDAVDIAGHCGFGTPAVFGTPSVCGSGIRSLLLRATHTADRLCRSAERWQIAAGRRLRRTAATECAPALLRRTHGSDRRERPERCARARELYARTRVPYLDTLETSRFLIKCAESLVFQGIVRQKCRKNCIPILLLRTFSRFPPIGKVRRIICLISFCRIRSFVRVG